jgi:hypothetical protein
MDTKFWGPSGWELLHLITFEKGYLSKKKELFQSIGPGIKTNKKIPRVINPGKNL